MYRHSIAGKNHNVNVANRFCENVAKLRYLVMTTTPEEIVRLNSGSACCHPVQYLLCSHLLSKNVKADTRNFTDFLVVLYRCETLFLTLIKEHGEYLVLSSGRQKEAGENCKVKNFILCAASRMLTG
jgi:hypothetical protein